MTLAEEHTENSQRFLSDAEEAVRRGDLLQASKNGLVQRLEPAGRPGATRTYPMTEVN